MGRVTKYVYDGQSRLVEVLYPYTETKKTADLQEAAEAGLHVTPSQGQGILYNPGAVELNALRTLLNRAGGNRGSMVGINHVMWKEQYSYDGNGNRLSKTTPWGTVQYQYDRENRLTSRGDIAYSYDRDGNLLTERGSYREAEYRYNGQHRMVYSAITDVIERTRVSTAYQYDGFGRRTVTQEAGHETMRTLYDAFTFEVVREGITHVGGTFTTQFETGRLTDLNTGTEGSRYRWIGEAQNDSRYRYIGDEAPTTRYTGISVTLYGRGEAVAINRNASTGGRGSSAYLGKDILGSVRSSTNEYGIQEDRYEYDAFGKPYEGDFSGGMNLGYTGKPYDTITGLYNYGYRDYAPVAARFTTVDPIRDGANWFSYVNNDPVNYLDLWGLSANDNTRGGKSEKNNPNAQYDAVSTMLLKLEFNQTSFVIIDAPYEPINGDPVERAIDRAEDSGRTVLHPQNSADLNIVLNNGNFNDVTTIIISGGHGTKTAPGQMGGLNFAEINVSNNNLSGINVYFPDCSLGTEASKEILANSLGTGVNINAKPYDTNETSVARFIDNASSSPNEKNRIQSAFRDVVPSGR
ncbi:hypothetical protein FACS1894151_06700 [Spirochaetia bacterium]|nr:hypothetical protein FACS1894151_06700 [Spirochaetia bacterium]